MAKSEPLEEHEAVPTSLEFWAQRKPTEPALVEGIRVVTWAEWNDLADRLATALSLRGVARDDIVVVRCKTRIEWAIVASALAKLDCFLLGLNWRLNASESLHILKDSGAAALICDDEDPSILLPVVDELPLKAAISVDKLSPGFEVLSELLEAEPVPRFAARDARLVVYTSGTTSLPKGVVPREHTREELKELAEYQASVAAARKQFVGDVVMVSLPMHHGAGPSQFHRSLHLGNLTVLMRRFEPELALELIQKHQINFWSAVPTLFKRMASLPMETIARYDLSSIRVLGVGAAPVSQDLKIWIARTFGDVLHEGYGSTETGMVTGLEPALQHAKPGSCGRPFTHVSISIRDPQGLPLPIGETGEIWVKTPVVIRQYLNEPPLGPDMVDAQGFFRTGDAGHVDLDGFLFITDRVKDMIISGGVNIYPAEIEAAIIRHPAIQDAAVIGIPDEEFGEQVKAFCELAPGCVTVIEDINAHCAASLASYKRPKTIDIVDELPRNPMGKILKRTLREPYWTGREKRV